MRDTLQTERHTHTQYMRDTLQHVALPVLQSV